MWAKSGAQVEPLHHPPTTNTWSAAQRARAKPANGGARARPAALPLGAAALSPCGTQLFCSRCVNAGRMQAAEHAVRVRVPSTTQAWHLGACGGG